MKHGLIFAGSTYNKRNDFEFMMNIYNGKYEDGKKMFFQFPLKYIEKVIEKDLEYINFI